MPGLSANPDFDADAVAPLNAAHLVDGSSPLVLQFGHEPRPGVTVLDDARVARVDRDALSD